MRAEDLKGTRVFAVKMIGLGWNGSYDLDYFKGRINRLWNHISKKSLIYKEMGQTCR
jgi:hypothetical protein